MNKLIYMRTNQFDFTFQFKYFLGDDHKIYIKSFDEACPKTIIDGNIIEVPSANWYLFDRLGVPYNSNYESMLEPNEFIVEISVASEVIVAVSNFNRVYLYKPTRPKRPMCWSKRNGKPFPLELYLPASRRSWSFSVSIGDKLKKKVDFMDPRERAAFYSDGNGVRHDFGYTATIYVLLQDGRRIMYWDTGLVSSFSRGFLTPLNGTTEGQMLSAAGSAIFISVLDSYGNLRFFTRMFDYEINGCCPGFTFSYDDSEIPQPTSAGGFSLGQGVRKIPLNGWLEHETSGIPQCLLSYKISIHLVGQGDAARELRILGRNSYGQSGIYSKFIHDRSPWKFKLTDEQVRIPLIPYPFCFPITLLLKNYYGCILQNIHSEISIELRGFHYLNTPAEPAQLVLTYYTQVAYVNLHTVDGWDIIYHKKDHEDLIGTSDGEAKCLRGTFIIPKTQMYHLTFDTPLSQMLRTFFMPYHLKTNALQLSATDELVKIKGNNDPLSIIFDRALTTKEIESSYYMRQALNPELGVYPTSTEHCLKLIQSNTAALNKMRETHKHVHSDNLKFFAVNEIARRSRPLAGPFSKVYFFINRKSQLIPKKEMGKKALADTKPLFKSHSEICFNAALKEKHHGYEQAKMLLKRRITWLSELSRGRL